MNDEADYYRDEMLDNRSAMQSLYEAQRQLDKMNAKLARVTAERDGLAEAFGAWTRIREWLEMDSYIRAYMLAEIAAIESMSQALAAVKGGEP